MLGGIAGLVGLSAVAGLLVTATITPAIAVSGAAASSAITMFDNMPSYLDIDELMLPTEIYAKNTDGSDRLLARFYDQNRVPKAYEEINPVMFDAILSSEDPRYYSHGGVDLIGTSRALLSNLRGSAQTQGGSSISQQYVKNILVQRCELTSTDPDAAYACWEQATTAAGSDGIERKLQEMRYAIALEQRYSKNDILLGYLNIANFGGTTYGVGAAAKYYFNVDASKLSIGQAATLAGMVQNPNTFRIDLAAGSVTKSDGTKVNGKDDGYSLTTDRRNYVLGRMLAEGKITQEQYDTAKAEPIAPAITPTAQGCAQASGAEFFCDYVRTIVENDEAFGATPEERTANLKRKGYKIYTSIDFDLQAAANNAIRIVPRTMDGIDLGSTGVQLEVGTGRVLSMTQNKLYSQSESQLQDPSYESINYNTRFVNGGSRGFNVGSTYKLFTLINWLENGHSVNEVLNATQRTFNVDRGCDLGIQTIRSGEIKNFEGVGGYQGTPMKFTADSLNTGFLAMSERVNVCDTNKVADKMGVTYATGTKVYEPLPGQTENDVNLAYEVLGSKNIAPIDMAAAYSTVASGGIYCEPKAIDKITDSSGNELPLPETKCERVLDEKVAATAAYVLEGVLNGGSASASRTGDGVPVFGKTGIHEQQQTWMDGSSTKVTTVVWVGNVIGESKLDRLYANGTSLWRMRHSIFPAMQRAANAKYGGAEFPSPDQDLTRRVLVDLPDVTGQPVEQAQQTLEDAGFTVTVGSPVDGLQDAGIVETQDPGAGRVAGGTVVTISPSNGQGIQVPDNLLGMNAADAVAAIRSAGFGRDPGVRCIVKEGGSPDGVVTGVNPRGGTVVNRNAQLTIAIERDNCG